MRFLVKVSRKQKNQKSYEFARIHTNSREFATLANANSYEFVRIHAKSREFARKHSFVTPLYMKKNICFVISNWFCEHSNFFIYIRIHTFTFIILQMSSNLFIFISVVNRIESISKISMKIDFRFKIFEFEVKTIRSISN